MAEDVDQKRAADEGAEPPEGLTGAERAEPEAGSGGGDPGADLAEPESGLDEGDPGADLAATQREAEQQADGGAGEAEAEPSAGAAGPGSLEEPGLTQEAETTAELAEGRAANRAPHPIWRLGKALLTLALMAGATWALYHGLVYVAGPTLAARTQSYKLTEYSPQAYDRQGVAEILFAAVEPLPETEGEGVLITWTAHNIGTKTWFPSTHHWEPLSPDLPPLPLPGMVLPYDSVRMAVRLDDRPGPIIGWRLMGLEGPVQEGQIEISISAADERK